MEEYSYQKSGVHLKNAEMLAQILSCQFQSANFQNFAGLFESPALPEYYFAATTDGIGTKIIPLIERKMYRTIALDLAAMNLNDLACVGAKPLFFLDYIAANKLNPKEVSKFVSELHYVLKTFNCVLIGGETSELGDFIPKGLFDAAGFAVGLVKKENLIPKKNVKAGDVVIGLKSAGVHSNGFSLVRKLYADKKINEEEFIKTLAPTEIYTNEILEMCNNGLVSGLANITGGGILSNLERAIPDGLMAVLDKTQLPQIEVFQILNKFISTDEMFHTFNMGAGFCIIADSKNVEAVMQIAQLYSPFIFGEIKRAEDCLEGGNVAKAMFKN